MARTVSTTLCLAILATSLPLQAQTPQMVDLTEEQREKVAQLLLEAKRAFSSKDYEVALDRLVKAYDLFPDANVQRRIGEALERLRRDRDALEVYRNVLAREDLDPNIRDAVERRVAFLDDILKSRRATVRVRSERPETQVFVADEAEPRGTAPLELKLDPGSYTLRAEAGGDEVFYQVTLDEKQNVQWSPVWPTVEQTEPGEEGGSSVLGWTFVGLGGAAFVTGATTLILAASEASTLDEYDADRQGPRPADYAEVEDRYNTLVLVSWVSAGVGAVFTGLGAYFLISDAEESQVSIAPTTGGAQVIWRATW